MTSVRTRYVTTTLLMIAVAAVAVALQGRDERPALRLAAGQARATSRLPAPPPPLTATALLGLYAELALSHAQVGQLEDAARRWREETAGLEAAAERARAELARFVETAGGRASVDELQRRSAEYRELSAELRSRRVRHAGAVHAMLTDTQRSTLARAPSPGRGGEPR